MDHPAADKAAYSVGLDIGARENGDDTRRGHRRGRIDRDDWVRQAKALADGGEAEYIRVFGKKPR